MSKTVVININNNVRVKLTSFGRQQHHRDHVMFWTNAGRVMPYTQPKEDAEGWSTWQLHSLMEAFGSYMTIGAEKLPFETNIEVVLP